MNNDVYTSALALHAENTGHNINFDSFKILEQENKKKETRIF